MAQIAVLNARFARRENGTTFLREMQTSAPLKIARPFPRARDGGLDVCVMDASPGLLCGDEYCFSWHLEAQTTAQTSTQGFTRVHPARHRNGVSLIGVSKIETQIFIERDARFFHLPEPILPYPNARLDSYLRVFIEDGATFCALESLAAGRIARGEIWEFERLHNYVLIEDARGPIFCAQTQITPQSPVSPRSFITFGDFTHSANLICIGDFPSHIETVSRETVERLTVKKTEKNPFVAAFSPLARRGFIVQMFASRGHEILEITKLLVDFVSRET